MPVLDALVLGKGPAGIAAAAALAEQGLAVGVLGPAGPVRWPAQYGAWADELDLPHLRGLASHAWPTAMVSFGEGASSDLARTYVRIDRDRLARRLLERCERNDVRWLEGRATAVAHEAARTLVTTDGGTDIAARLVVDASGHRPALVRRPPSPAQGFQTAFGMVIEYDGPLFPAGRAVLMDWDDGWIPPARRSALPPTFLYALPLGEGRLFVEETVLVARPVVPLKLLEARLRRRLEDLGIRDPRPLEVERCWIPMGGSLPDLTQRVVGFGAAAGMVHPATGYLLARTLARAPELARVAARELGAPDADPARTAASAWQTLWSPDRRHRRALFCFGTEVLLRLDPPRTRTFFREFFALPPDEWQGFFSDRLPAPQLRVAMARLFRRVPSPVRNVLVGTAAGRPGMALARALLRTHRG